MQIQLAGRYPLQRAELVTDYHEDEASLALDARCLQWASPLELAALVTLGTSAAAQDRKVVLMLPDDRDVAAYLARMNVVDLLEPIAEIDGTPPAQRRRDQSGKLLEVTGVSKTSAKDVAARLGEMAFDRLGSKLGAVAFNSLGELLNNATMHGNSDLGAFTTAQLYTGASSGVPGFAFAVCDAGVGIFERLRASARYRELHDDAAAIELALQDGVSDTTTVGRGYGLGDLGASIARDGGGRLMLRSGAAIASLVLRTRRPISIRSVATPIDGTWAWLRVRVP